MGLTLGKSPLGTDHAGSSTYLDSVGIPRAKTRIMEPEHLLLSPEGRFFRAAAERAPRSGSARASFGPDPYVLAALVPVTSSLGAERSSWGEDSTVVARLRLAPDGQ
jgi:hypothetical protein